jgi:hypothetical protein
MTTFDTHCRRITILVSLVLLARLDAGAQSPESPESPDAEAGADAAAPTEEISNPAGGDSPVIEQVEPPAPPRARRLVYACRDGSIPMFSDRPCGDRSDTRQLPTAPATAGRAPSTLAPAPVAATRPIAKPAPRRTERVPPDRCQRLEEQLAVIDDRMRQGYSARAAARLWQRWREAKARLRDAQC